MILGAISISKEGVVETIIPRDAHPATRRKIEAHAEQIRNEVAMLFPKTLEELTKAGYKFEGYRKCSGPQCSATIEFWKTPSGKLVPLDIDEHGKVVAHFATCPDAGR